MLDAHALTTDDLLALAGISSEACDNAIRSFFKKTPLAQMQDRADLMLTAVTSEHQFYQSYGSLMATTDPTSLGGIAPLGTAYDGMLSIHD